MLLKDIGHLYATDKDKYNKDTAKARKVQTNDGPSRPSGKEGPSRRASWADRIKKCPMGLNKVKPLDIKLK